MPVLLGRYCFHWSWAAAGRLRIAARAAVRSALAVMDWSPGSGSGGGCAKCRGRVCSPACVKQGLGLSSGPPSRASQGVGALEADEIQHIEHRLVRGAVAVGGRVARGVLGLEADEVVDVKSRGVGGAVAV